MKKGVFFCTTFSQGIRTDISLKNWPEGAGGGVGTNRHSVHHEGESLSPMYICLFKVWTTYLKSWKSLQKQTVKQLAPKEGSLHEARA